MHFFPFSSSSHKDGGSRVPVYLNVYDLTTVNNYLYWFGLGIFHSGIEVHGMEFSFGAHEYPSSGIFEVEPRSCPGFIFRRAVLLGKTSLSRSEVQEMMEHLSRDFHGDCYHLITKNCNHFTDEACLKLTGKAVPGWVNRLARLVSGSFCNCLLPESIKVAPVQHLPDQQNADDDDEAASFISSASLASDEEENSNHHLLTVPNVEVSIVKEKPIRLAKELL
ncbi:DeSI-like protein At4g17486 [Linum perenne]